MQKKTLLLVFVATLLAVLAVSVSLAGSLPVCHVPPGNPANAHTVWVGSQEAVDAHLANHPGDTAGECRKICDTDANPQGCFN